jgi:hypothetical protein
MGERVIGVSLETTQGLLKSQLIVRKRYFIPTLVMILIAVFDTAYTQISFADSGDELQVAWTTAQMKINSQNDFSVDITPLADNSLNLGRGFDWGWSTPEGGPPARVWLGLNNKSGDGFASLSLNVESAVGLNPLRGSKGVNCSKNNIMQIGSGERFQGYCSIGGFPLSLGITYRLHSYFDQTLGPTWLTADITNLTTGEKLQVGSIDVGDAQTDRPVTNPYLVVFDRTPNTTCGIDPINDTIFSRILLGGTELPNPTSIYEAACLKAAVVNNRGSLGGLVLKYGGANPGSRNLEGAPQQPSASPAQSPLPTQKPTPTTIPTPTPPRSFSFSFDQGVAHISVDIPGLLRDGITSVSLVSSELGYPADAPLQGVIDSARSRANFDLPINSSLGGQSIPVRIYANSPTSTSDPLTATVPIPKVSVAPNKVTPSLQPIAPKNAPAKEASQLAPPATPTDPSYHLNGNQVIVSVKTHQKPGANATGALLIAPNLGFTQSHPLVGHVAGSVANFDLTLNPAMAGKTAQIAIYLTNAAGPSAPLAGQVTLPPVIPSGSDTGPQSTPHSQQTNAAAPGASASTVKCRKGPTSRTFTASTCPPGWVKG